MTVRLATPRSATSGLERLSNPRLLAGTTILGGVVLLAIFAPWITPYDPIQQDLQNILLQPSSEHLLGTDHLGRDVWTRIIYAVRIDLALGIGAIIPPFVIGSVLGAMAGWYGGKLDTLVSGLGDLLMAFPYYVLIIALVFALRPGISSIVVAVGMITWVSYARILRSEVLSEKNREYVLAAKASGISDRRLLTRHLGPNVIGQAVVFSMSNVVNIIVGIVTLSYFGLGVPPPTPDWGAMIAAGQPFITTNWQLSAAPGIAVIVVGVGLALIGDGLAEVLEVPE